MAAQFRLSAQQKASSSSSEQQAAKPGEVHCDVCTGTKPKALKTCLVCLVSYCQTHLEPHLTTSGLKKHHLIDPVENLEDRMGAEHDKLLELLFGKLSTFSDHKNHDVVPLKEGYEGKKAELGKTDDESQKMIQKRRQKIQEIKHSVELSEEDADRAIAGGVQVFTALKESVERSQAELIDTIKEKQRKTEKQGEGFIKELEQEICELKKRSTEVEQLSRSEDHLHLLQSFRTLHAAPPTKNWTGVRVSPPSYEGTVRRALNQLEETLSERIKQSSSPPIPKQRHLKLALLNTQSLNNNDRKCLILKEFITDSNLDFLCLTETWHKPPDYVSLNQTTPTGFTYIERPCPEGQAGGIAAVYRKDIQTTSIPIPAVPSFEHLVFRVSEPTPLVTAVIYRPQSQSKPSFLADFSDFLPQLCAISPAVLLLGDFNFHMGDPAATPAREFLELLRRFDFTQHVNFPTHRGGHVLDLVCSTGLTIPQPFGLDLDVSDHLAITADIDILMPIP